MRLRSKITGAAVGTASVVFFAAAPSASAHVAGSPPQLQVIKTVSSAYVGPLQFAVDGKVIYVADSFTSTLNRLERDGHNTVIANRSRSVHGWRYRRRRRRPVPPRACVHQQHRRPLAHHPDDPAAGRQADHRQPVQIRSGAQPRSTDHVRNRPAGRPGDDKVYRRRAGRGSGGGPTGCGPRQHQLPRHRRLAPIRRSLARSRLVGGRRRWRQ